MKRTGSIFIFGLLVLFLAGVGSAFAVTTTSSSLNGTTWSGNITLMTAGGAATSASTFSISFTFDSDTNPDFLSGTFTEGTNAAVPFSAIREGCSLSIVAEGYIIHADIFYPRGGWRQKSTTPTTMYIKGKSLNDGSQFVGSLTQPSS